MLATLAGKLGYGISIVAATVVPVRGPYAATIPYNVTICQEFLSGPSRPTVAHLHRAMAKPPKAPLRRSSV